ncbi:hypothetical protein San01_60570 [Streptomyces angustmyceticus]|uniref:Uncharacterized protein n=1 Tax=Streptomyces angustmyceticus TaxID=285578 RepID=A0A5J4LPZ9_9ACTN|nr:hypothetical protein San01_60570 [Streptomyces angustmyceticus]
MLLGWFTDTFADWPRQDRDDLVRLLSHFADDVTTRLALLVEERTEPPLPSATMALRSPCPAFAVRRRLFGTRGRRR